MEEKKREGRSSRMNKEVVEFVQSMVGKEMFLVQFEDGKKKYMSSFSLLCLCLKEEVCLEMDEPISNHHEKERGKLLTIDGDPDVEEPSIL